nr:unnamed protein product [Callosobruchus chinensis]
MSLAKCPDCFSGFTKQGSSLSCDGCHNEVHLTCVGLNADEVRITLNKSKAVKFLCNSCSKLMGELGDLKGLLTSLKDDFTKKISDLEQKINELTHANIGPSLEDSLFEDVVQEISEREYRKKNVMIFGTLERERAERQRTELLMTSLLSVICWSLRTVKMRARILELCVLVNPGKA